MAEGDFFYPPTFGLGPGSDSILSFNWHGAYADNGCSETLYLEQQRQSTTGDFWESSLDTADIIHDGSDTTQHAASSPKHGRGRPRKTDTDPWPKKKVKTSRPSPSTSQASPQELPTDTSRPEDDGDDENLHPSPPEDASETRLPDAKIDSRRERNRVAAQKCRTRKQHDKQKLVADVTAAEAINESLRRESDGLREETLLLKNMVLQHGDCDCAYIQCYIKNAVSRLTQAAPASSPSSRTVHEHKKQQQHAAAYSADADEDILSG